MNGRAGLQEKPIPSARRSEYVREMGDPCVQKGECMWYDDILFDGLPVWVDPEIKLKGKSGQWHTFHPDFIFKCFDGTYIYVEHFGYLDDDEYAEKAKRKLQEYLDCGIVLGDNLIVTSDNADHRTNEIMIREALDKNQKAHVCISRWFASVRLFLFRSFFRNLVTFWNFSLKKEQNTPSNRALSFLFYSFFQNPVTFWEFPLKKEQSTPLTRAFSFLFRSFFQNPVTFSNFCSRKKRELIRRAANSPTSPAVSAL